MLHGWPNRVQDIISQQGSKSQQMSSSSVLISVLYERQCKQLLAGMCMSYNKKKKSISMHTNHPCLSF